VNAFLSLAMTVAIFASVVYLTRGMK